MTTTTSTKVSLPRGAVGTEEWQPNGDRFYRNFEGENLEVAAGTKYGADAVVYAHGLQHDDGSIDDGTTDPVFDAPAISISTIGDDDGRQTDTGITLTSEAARRLADVLVTAADEVDGLSAR
jgi:hypothetical protein